MSSGLFSAHDVVFKEASEAKVYPKVPTVLAGNNLLAFDKFYTCDSSSASVQTLPAATGSNRIITVENTGTGLLTVDGNAAETINGATTQVLGQYSSVTLRDYASGKWIIMY
jgi:hypothetical protein